MTITLTLTTIRRELTKARIMQDWDRVRELTDERNNLQSAIDTPALALSQRVKTTRKQDTRA